MSQENPFIDIKRLPEYKNWCALQQQGEILPTYEEWLKTH